jgi:hypothetical protein
MMLDKISNSARVTAAKSETGRAMLASCLVPFRHRIIFLISWRDERGCCLLGVQMAVIEIEFREQGFFNIIAAQILRIDPAALLSQLPTGALTERVEPGIIAFANDGEILFSDGKLALNVPLAVHITNYAAAKAEGSLQKPAPQPVACTLWLPLQGAAPSQLRWLIRPRGDPRQVHTLIAPPRTIPIGRLGAPVQRQ